MTFPKYKKVRANSEILSHKHDGKDYFISIVVLQDSQSEDSLTGNINNNEEAEDKHDTQEQQQQEGIVLDGYLELEFEDVDEEERHTPVENTNVEESEVRARCASPTSSF